MRKLEEIIREYYIESLGASQLDDRYGRFLTIAISGLRDLNNDIKNVVTDALLPVNDNLTVDLPKDYVDYMVIGQIRDGRILSLGLNNNAAPLTKDSCGNPINNSIIEGSDKTSFFVDTNSTSFSEDGQFVGRRYGLGGGGNNLGTYRVFKDQNYIALNGFSGDEVFMRYFSNIQQVDGSFMVDEYMVEALKAWMYWKYIQRSRSYNMQDKQVAQMTYNKAKRQAQIRVSRFNIPEFMNAYKSGFRSAPRI